MPKRPVESIAISEFKATCLAVLERVRRTGSPIVVTRRGQPIAEVFPPSPASVGDTWLGAMNGTATMLDDLVAPVSGDGEWEAVNK